MDLGHVLGKLLRDSNIVSTKNAENILPRESGLYAIFVNDPVYFPQPFGDYLVKKETKLIYVGLASKSLYSRLFEQDLRHQKPSTFFRAIGAILGYRPPAGSLTGRGNRNNYKFNHADTQAIIGWIEQHLLISHLCMSAHKLRAEEKEAITSLKPILNSHHNPEKLPEFAELRAECRKIALTD